MSEKASRKFSSNIKARLVILEYRLKVRYWRVQIILLAAIIQVTVMVRVWSSCNSERTLSQRGSVFKEPVVQALQHYPTPNS